MAIWKAQRTLLIVGEGYHEEAFLNHVKQLYAPRGCGLSVTVKNAHGKGAKHVIDWTIRQIANTAYDAVAAMLDTDTDWTAAVGKQAKAKKIRVLASEPCFDAVMLRLLGKNPVGDAKTLKKHLAPYVNDDPTMRQNYAAHFGPECLEAGRANEPSIDTLLKLLGY
jgi:hypothetical protein